MTAAPTTRLLSPLHYDLGRQLRRIASNPPPQPDDPDTWAWLAVVPLAHPDIADALRAVHTLTTVTALHQPRPWGNSSTVIACTCGHGTWADCPTGRATRGDP